MASIENINSLSDVETQPLRVLIVGAGIGGLTAAIALRQQGHDVDIYEQSRLAQETGAAIHLAPNANGLLRRFGLYAENIGAVECKGVTEFKPDGSLKYSIDLSQANKMWSHPWHLVHRAHLHTALKEMALGEAGKGRPARLHVSSRVKAVDSASAAVYFDNDSKVQGDLIVGGDGVHSLTRASIPGGDLKAFDSGKSAFRFLIPTESLASDSDTKSFIEKDDFLTMWIGEDRRLIMYPCVEKTVMNFVGIHPSQESSADIKGEGWQETGSKTRMLQIFDSFGTGKFNHSSLTFVIRACLSQRFNVLIESIGVASILTKADEEKIKVWKLLDMNKMPSFVHEKLAVIGDAAHPFLPHQGQFSLTMTTLDVNADLH
jgi:2-polyprenyl-6-methoxyphenol hydroxylase-like FAD-dependent oxidoreductase